MTDASDAVGIVRSYHDRTKHHLHQYAQSLGYMDWATQPNPFRSYNGSERIALLHPPALPEPGYDALFAGTMHPASLSFEFVSRLFYDSLALSAWKQTPQSRSWSLRINPSSGALQPTESYLIAGPTSPHETTGIFHYNVHEHALEKRLALTASDWQALTGSLPFPCVFLGLASIYWRESWKYGERAFRYCQHDVGHAIGCVAFAARLLGWRAYLLNAVADDDLAVLLGIHTQQGNEAEHPDCLLAICPHDADVGALSSYRLPAQLIGRLRTARFEGTANQLSKSHHDWPIIDEVSRATKHPGSFDKHASERTASRPLLTRRADVPAQQIIRQRRSAVDMDGSTHLAKDDFYRMMQRVLPTAGFPFDVLPWQPRVALAMFVQRVTDLERGLYILIRDPAHRPSLLSHLRTEFEWRKPTDCPPGLELYLLTAADTGRAAKMVSCHQDIAADGAFSLGMLAEFDAGLAALGPSGYPRLFWETGLIGQVLYLEAEAAGIRATGIGCFFDDAMHDVLGITDHSWQSLYHFTVGKAVEDVRLKTIAPYQHLA